MASIEERLSKLEAEISLLRGEVRDEAAAHRGLTADIASARHLAGAADRDVSELAEQMRAHTRSLNALRETQVEHYGTHQAAIAALGDEARAGFAALARMLEQLGAQPDS